jgi:hypothetical protein
MRTGLCVIGLSVILSAAEVRSAQALPEWRLTPPLSDVEKARDLALAARLDIDRPAVITREIIHHPLDCESLRIESVPAVDGNRRTSKRIWVSNTDWPRRCPSEKPDSTRVDKWVVADRVPDVGAWRVQDRDGIVDVESPSAGVPRQHGAAESRRKVDLSDLERPDGPLVAQGEFSDDKRGPLVAVQGTRVELRGWMTEIA